MAKLGYRLVIVAVCAAAYEWCIVEAIVPELLAALFTGVVALLAHERLVAVSPPRFRVSLRFIGPLLLRVLPAVVSESFDLLVPTLWRALVLRHDVRGRWIALRYDPRDQSPALECGRRTVVVAGSNLTPNALPLDVDLHVGRLILHQLVPRREAAAADPRYPM